MATDFIQESKSGGAQAMLTIPIIGWVAKLGAGRASLASYNPPTNMVRKPPPIRVAGGRQRCFTGHRLEHYHQ